MAKTYVEETITNVEFQNGATLSGTLIAEYSPDGKLLDVTSAHIVATSTAGTTTFESLAPALTNPVGGYYEIRSTETSLTGPFTGLDLTFQGEHPSHLSVNDFAGLFTSLQTANSDASVVATGLTLNGGGTITTETVCFFSGTLISVPSGRVPIEKLIAGDIVVTSNGESRPIRWLGRQTVSTRFADPLRVFPIRIKAGALGGELPERDLLVSPGHALLLDGLLVQAGALVNDVSIFRETTVPETFTYYHIELADHTLILAEGVPAETFVDNVHRLNFDNWAEHEALGEDAVIGEMEYPRVMSARQLLPEIRERLMRCSEKFGSCFAA